MSAHQWKSILQMDTGDAIRFDELQSHRVHVGNRRLTVRSERFLRVLSLIRGRGGDLANLSR